MTVWLDWWQRAVNEWIEAWKRALSREERRQIEEPSSQPFDQMILTREDAPSTAILDLFQTPDFVGRGYIVFSQPPETAVSEFPTLHPLEIALGEELWKSIKSDSKLPDARRSIAERGAFTIPSYIRENPSYLEHIDPQVNLTIYQPDPDRNVWVGNLENTGVKYRFLLEEFGSPDPLSVIIALGGIAGTGLLGIVMLYLHFKQCYERAIALCGEGKVAALNSSLAVGIGPTKLGLDSLCNPVCREDVQQAFPESVVEKQQGLIDAEKQENQKDITDST